MNVHRYHLAIPGPVEVRPEVLTALSSQIVAHYGSDWLKIYNETLDLLKQIFQTDGDVFTIVGSGSAGLEAAIGTLVAPGEEIIVLSNGYFGERLAEIARFHTSKVTVLQFPPTSAVDPVMLRRVLVKKKQVKAVGVVHCETSTGVLNPVGELASVCHQNEIPIIVDAVSSLGGVQLEVKKWQIDICVSASQKCLESPPGLALVSVSKEIWPVIKQTAPSSWYLNLAVWKAYAERWADRHPYPTTMATPLILALREALKLILAEGLERRFERHRRTAGLLREGLQELGFEPLVPPEIASPTVVTARGREDFPPSRLVEELKERFQIQIAGGIGELEGQIFRIGNMGPQAKQERVATLLQAIRSLME